MLYLASVNRCYIFRQTQDLGKKAPDYTSLAKDQFNILETFRCQSVKTVMVLGYKAPGFQFANSHGNASASYIQILGDIDSPGITVFPDQIINSHQVMDPAMGDIYLIELLPNILHRFLSHHNVIPILHN